MDKYEYIVNLAEKTAKRVSQNRESWMKFLTSAARIYKLAEAKDRLETLTNQLESAKIEVTKPFQQEEELAEKLKRLAELNALLNMDEKGTDALILEDDEQPAIVNSDMAVTPITSVKTKPMLKKKVVGLCL